MPDIPTTPYELMGGDAAVRRLVDRFYDLMDSSPEATSVRALHPESLIGSREKLYLFLVGWAGGPQTYIERYGHPRLRMRHLPFAIGTKARDEWLWCMNQALTEQEMGEDIREFLAVRFAGLADHMRNQ